jgi:acetaldehyde dehydrogenase (acetylating)
VSDWREGCERCIQILRYGGMGHTMSIHSRNEDVILQFGLKKPAFRICVNTPTTHGSIGLTTGLDPAMTLGCGGWGGNITSDNISPRHLLNVKRLAYEIRPAVPSSSPRPESSYTAPTPIPPSPVQLPKAPRLPDAKGISATALAARIDTFLESRGYRPAADKKEEPATTSVQSASSPVAFVCEDDVRTALRTGQKVVIDEKTIVTPAARDLGESQRVFVQAGWPR